MPAHGFKIKVPKEWDYKDGRGGGLLVNSSRDSFIKLGVYPLPNEVDLKILAENELKLDVREGTELTISNFPAYIGIADQSSGFFGPGPARFVLIGDTSNKKVLVLGGYGKNDLRKIRDDRTYVATIFSFDFMTLDDYRKAKPISLGCKYQGFLKYELRIESGWDYQKSKSLIDFCYYKNNFFQ